MGPEELQIELVGDANESIDIAITEGETKAKVTTQVDVEVREIKLVDNVKTDRAVIEEEIQLEDVPREKYLIDNVKKYDYVAEEERYCQEVSSVPGLDTVSSESDDDENLTSESNNEEYIDELFVNTNLPDDAAITWSVKWKCPLHLIPRDS